MVAFLAIYTPELGAGKIRGPSRREDGSAGEVIGDRVGGGDGAWGVVTIDLPPPLEGHDLLRASSDSKGPLPW